MRLIDADALIDMLGVSDEDINFREMLYDAPSIDIVRCRECRYKDMELCPMYKLVVAGVRKYDDFCSYGERREP